MTELAKTKLAVAESNSTELETLKVVMMMVVKRQNWFALTIKVTLYLY